MKTNTNLRMLLTAFLFLPVFIFSQSTIYVAPSGSSSNSGSQLSSPTTLENAVSNLSSGGTIYMQGGTYNYSSRIVISSNGSSGSLKKVFAQNGTPVINFSSMSESSSNIKWY